MSLSCYFSSVKCSWPFWCIQHTKHFQKHCKGPQAKPSQSYTIHQACSHTWHLGSCSFLWAHHDTIVAPNVNEMKSEHFHSRSNVEPSLRRVLQQNLSLSAWCLHISDPVSCQREKIPTGLKHLMAWLLFFHFKLLLWLNVMVQSISINTCKVLLSIAGNTD